MIAVDTNVLIYAHRKDSEFHKSAGEVLTLLAEGSSPWAVPVFCLGEYLRVITHPRVFNNPHTPREAAKGLSHLLASPSVQVLNPGAEFPTLLQKTIDTHRLRGNLVFDAQIVAVCVEHGVGKIVSEDKDFLRFSELTVETLDTV